MAGTQRFGRHRAAARQGGAALSTMPGSDAIGTYWDGASRRAEYGPDDPADGDQRRMEMLMSLATQEVATSLPAPDGLSRAAAERPGRIRFIPLPLVAILIAQAALSLRLVRSSTAYTDEALYLWAGHLEWAHWLHGTTLPAFPTFFSGAPVIYPPLGALADSIGGLAGARDCRSASCWAPRHSCGAQRPGSTEGTPHSSPARYGPS